MRVMVTGAAGFIGSHLVERLASEGNQVLAVDSVTDYYDVGQKEANLALLSARPGVELVREDLMTGSVVDQLADVQVVYHLAGQPGVRLSWDKNFATYVERNLLCTQALLERAREVALPRLVFASSSSVYGNQVSYPVDEDAVPRPYSPYGVTKLAAEHLCSLYAENYGLSTVSLRFFTVYGPRQRPDMAFSKFIRAALAGEAIRITGDGSAVRDFTFVTDIVDALVSAAAADVAPGSVYNTCGTESVTVNEAVGMIGEAIGAPPEVVHAPALPGDVQRTGGDSERAARELSWSPATQLRDGIPQQVAWERTRR